MRIIGFNFTKISAEKGPDFRKASINTNIDFINIEKDEFTLLKEDQVLKIQYKFSINYESEDKKKENLAQIIFEGTMMLSVTEEESKDILKSWKKKELPNSFKIPLFNLILKKCSSKALGLQDELNLPSHIPLPQIKKADAK